MKKWIAVLVILGLLVGGWWGVRTFVRVQLPGEEPKFEKVARGDVRVPITAAGLIEPYQRIEIKPEASGEVLKVHVVEGMRVRPGDPLVDIKEDDELRNVEKAAANLQRAQALLAQANIAVKKSASSTTVAKARVAELEANGRQLQIDLNREKNMTNKTLYNIEVLETNVAMNTAQVEAAKAQAEIAAENERDALQAVRLQEAVVSDATATERDAKTRFERTKVIAKRDAVITEVRVKEGNVVQSGIGSVTGGSILLTMADVSKLKVITRVDEADYGRVAAVTPIDYMPDMNDLRKRMAQDKEQLEKRTGIVRVTVDAFPEETFEGKIERVEPQGKLNTGSSIIQFDVHVEITDEKRNILPLGAQAQVEFTVESVKDVLTIPADAVKQFENEKGVYIRGGTQRDAKPRFIKCRFGITDGSITHLVGALSESDNELLKEGVEVYTKLPVVRDEEKK